MSLPANQAFQQNPYYPADIRYYQFKAVTGTPHFKGVFLDRLNQQVGSFDLTFSTSTATGFPHENSPDIPPLDAVAAIGRLTGSVYVNTGWDFYEQTGTTLDGDHGWVEYANDRYAIGLVG